jgi:hypothetical protein
MRIWVCMLFLCCFGRLSAQQPTVPAKDITRYLSFTNADFDMGLIPAGKPLEYNVTIKNISRDTIRLLDVKAGCGCTTPKYRTGDLILPGKSIFITLGFNGSAVGEFSKTADLFFTDSLTRQVKFRGFAVADSALQKPAINK